MNALPRKRRENYSLQSLKGLENIAHFMLKAFEKKDFFQLQRDEGGSSLDHRGECYLSWGFIVLRNQGRLARMQ